MCIDTIHIRWYIINTTKCIESTHLKEDVPMKQKRRVGLYERMCFESKEELLDGISKHIKKLKASYTESEKKTEKYIEYEKFLKRFFDGVKLLQLPTILDKEWSYSFGVSEFGAMVSLDKLEFKSETKVRIIASYKLKAFETRLLPSNEYAKLHGVSDTTVRQWIRRGKLRTANKYGNTWRIPEFAEPNKGQYCNVLMGWDAILTDLFPEYEFINDYDEVQIQQINKEEYKVWFANNKTRAYTIKTMSRNERERFELMMISNPFVNLYDLPGIDIDLVEASWNR